MCLPATSYLTIYSVWLSCLKVTTSLIFHSLFSPTFLAGHRVPARQPENLNVSLIIQSVTQSVIPRMCYLAFTLSYQDFAFELSLSRISPTCPVIASRPTSLSSCSEICVAVYGSVVKLFRLNFYRPRDLPTPPLAAQHHSEPGKHFDEGCYG